jgi:anti-sigma factor RsiW
VKHRCEDFRGLVGDSSDLGTLSAQERATLDEHLGECDDCLASLKGIVVQRSVLRSVFREAGNAAPLPETFVVRCVEAMKRAATGGDSQSGIRTA